ncbi:hypothetical protein N7456_006945 [Penicillium angulare]|uniref:Uncharacterized protein n=1 Tax=Penicillium angulare TaxID=116970 RepID=A0A9W9FIU5_9EURO|nr:hypothetical protein N7456_006945 [Penicillium angulare]
MGRVLNAFIRVRERRRTKQFKLNHVPLCTPQSALDKKIFFPNWQPRPEWKHRRGVDFVGNACWIFTSPDDPTLRLDEMQLKLNRNLSFQPVFENGGIIYKRADDPPLTCITSPTALDTAKPYCAGTYR